MADAAPYRNHRLILNDRTGMNLSGVKDVISFDVSQVLLETEAGMLMIKGEDLHVSRLMLEEGEVDVEGRVDSLVYSEVTSYAKKAENLFGRLFK
jgi:sporulation protein YabP